MQTSRRYWNVENWRCEWLAYRHRTNMLGRNLVVATLMQMSRRLVPRKANTKINTNRNKGNNKHLVWWQSQLRPIKRGFRIKSLIGRILLEPGFGAKEPPLGTPDQAGLRNMSLIGIWILVEPGFGAKEPPPSTYTYLSAFWIDFFLQFYGFLVECNSVSVCICRF